MKRIVQLKLWIGLSGLLLAQTAFSQVPSGFDTPTNIIDVSSMNCVTDMQPTVFKVNNRWSFPNVYAATYNGKYYNGFSTPLVADLNGDGKPEIIALGVSNNWDIWLNPTANRVDIIDASGVIVKSLTFPDGTFECAYGSFHGTPCNIAIGKASETDPYPSIIVTTSGNSSQVGRIYCYKASGPNFDYSCTANGGWSKTGTARFHYDYNTSNPNGGGTAYANFRYPLPYIADFNSDGKAELLVYNKIFDLETGTLVATTEPLTDANVGRKWWTNDNGGGWECYLGMMSVADFDNDGRVEIAAGNKVYKPNLNPDGSFSGSCSVTQLPVTVSGSSVVYAGDGFTAVGDINGDGQLDVVVLGASLESGDRNYKVRAYAWTPDIANNTATLIGALTVRFNVYEGLFGMPFVGDINNRPVGPGNKMLPEICFITGSLYYMSATDINARIHPQSSMDTSTGDNGLRSTVSAGTRNGFVLGLTYDETESDVEKKLKIAWALQHSDRSQCTGITTFDFANLGYPQVVYRDETSLRVINASSPSTAGKDLITVGESDPNIILLKNTSIHSYTGYEFPVVADINGDYSADFITFGSQTANTGADGRWSVAGRLYFFEGQGALAGAPPVWNQNVYCPLLVNTDLSIPSKPIPMLTQFPDKNGNMVIPYNGTYLQQPFVRSDYYYPAVLEPDAIISDLSIVGTPTATQTQISFKVSNAGASSISLSSPVAIYEGTVMASATKVIVTTYLNSTTPLTGAIYPNEATPRTVSFNLSGDFRGKRLWVVLSNDGNASTYIPAPGYYECEPSDNYAGVTSAVAVDDTYSFARGEYNNLDVLSNDYKICTDNNTRILVVGQSAPSLGRYVVNGSVITYRAGSTDGTDVISYKIVCGGDTSNVATATVTISGIDPAVTAYTWNGSASSNWGNMANWTPAGRPDYNSVVVIPANLSTYPDLKETDLAICDTIKFGAELDHTSAEIAKPMYLTYTAARVELVLPRNCWNMVSPPLRDMYSGDYVLEGTQFRMIPATVYAKDFASSNLNPAGAGGATWSVPHKTLDAPLGLGYGLAVWVDYSTGDPDPNVGELHPDGKFVFPSDSTKYYYYGMDTAYPMTYNKITNESGPLTRTNAARFIYEGALANPQDTAFNMPVDHGNDPSYTEVMLGNPLMSHVDYIQLMKNNPKLGNAFYIMKTVNPKDTIGKDNLVTYVVNGNDIFEAGTSIIPGFKIPPMQSFLAARNGNATFSTVAFGPSVSVTALTKLRSASSTVDELTYFNVEIDKDGSRESAITIMYRSTASNAFVNNEDARTVINPESTVATLYSRLDDGTATGALAAFNVIGDLSEPVELGIRSKNGGTYRFNFYDMSLFSVAQEIWLEDKGNTDTDGKPYRQNMTTNPVYDFSIGSGYTNDRFFVHFEKISTGVEKPAVASNISIFAANDRVTVASPNSDLIQQVEVLNLHGQTVAVRDGLNLDYLTMTLPAREAVYIVKVTTQKSQKTQKVFIK